MHFLFEKKGNPIGLLLIR